MSSSEARVRRPSCAAKATLSYAGVIHGMMEAGSDAPSILGVARDAGLAYNTVFAIYHNKAARVDLATLEALAKGSTANQAS